MAGKTSFQERLDSVNAQIDDALHGALRNRSNLVTVVVTKRHPLSLVTTAYGHGLREFGESQVQEGVPKVKASPDDITWHFIGHLQKNKVRKAVKYFQYIHSVDSLSLLQRIDAISAEERVCPKIFLQVNYTLDPDKHGLHPEAAAPVLESALSLKNVTCIGLMGMPPQHAGPEKIEAYFKGMASLRNSLQEQFPDWPGRLSLGMSKDFEIAIAAGSNFIRLGTVLCGERR